MAKFQILKNSNSNLSQLDRCSGLLQPKLTYVVLLLELWNNTGSSLGLMYMNKLHYYSQDLLSPRLDFYFEQKVLKILVGGFGYN